MLAARSGTSSAHHQIGGRKAPRSLTGIILALYGNKVWNDFKRQADPTLYFIKRFSRHTSTNLPVYDHGSLAGCESLLVLGPVDLEHERIAWTASKVYSDTSCWGGLETFENLPASITYYYWRFCAPSRGANYFTKYTKDISGVVAGRSARIWLYSYLPAFYVVPLVDVQAAST
eukprot:6209011-Pleurochrysis_carterae.AAC.7